MVFPLGESSKKPSRIISQLLNCMDKSRSFRHISIDDNHLKDAKVVESSCCNGRMLIIFQQPTRQHADLSFGRNHRYSV